MVVAQQHAPFLPGLGQPVDLAGATIRDLGALRSPAEGVGTSVERIMEDLHDAVVRRRLPGELADVDVAQHHRHLDVRRAQPQEHLTGAPELPELGEHQPNRPGDMLVGIDLDLAGLAPA